MLAILGVLVVLVSIFLPYALDVREKARRVRCSDNLRQIGLALNSYSDANHGDWPRVVFDMAHRGYVAFTGPDSQRVLGPGSSVRPNDVTASLWLLVRQGYISREYGSAAATFICPSSDDVVDPMTDATGRPAAPGQRGNFRSGKNLSYSYSSLFADIPRMALGDAKPRGFVAAADKNPGISHGSDVTGPGADASPFALRAGNSRNHGRVGMNVLYANGTVLWQTTPYCGQSHDNIYTAAATQPATAPARPDQRGVCGPQYGPAHAADSYLVPTADQRDAVAFMAPASLPVSRPATAATTLPATTQAQPPTTATAPATTTATAPASAPATGPTTMPTTAKFNPG